MTVWSLAFVFIVVHTLMLHLIAPSLVGKEEGAEWQVAFGVSELIAAITAGTIAWIVRAFSQ